METARSASRLVERARPPRSKSGQGGGGVPRTGILFYKPFYDNALEGEHRAGRVPLFESHAKSTIAMSKASSKHAPLFTTSKGVFRSLIGGFPTGVCVLTMAGPRRGEGQRKGSRGPQRGCDEQRGTRVPPHAAQAARSAVER